MNEDTKTKLSKLREKYKSLYDTTSENDKYIDEIENRLLELLEKRRHLDNPLFKLFIEQANAKITAINKRLVTERNIDEITRKVLFEARDIWLFNISSFGMDVNEENIQIELKKIDEYLER